MPPEDDLYADEGSQPNAPTSESDRAKPEGEEGEHADEGQQTALIPKSLLAGKHFEVGDSVVLKIVALHENDALVEYDESGPDEESDDNESEPASMGDSEYD